MDRIVRAVKQVTSRRLYNRPVSRPTNPATRSIFARLSSWTRQPPSPLFGGTAGNFAADPHVWSTGPNSYFMLYTTDYLGTQAIAMAQSSNLINWTPIVSPQYGSEYIIRGNGPTAGQNNQETACYYRTNAGLHHIYYIGYDSLATYQSQIYRATASSITGPYVREATPVVPFGTSGAYDDAAFTSPSIEAYNGVLYMNYTAWADSPVGASPGVINAASFSGNDGATWTKFGSIDWTDTFGVEASVHRGLDGNYYRVGTETFNSQDILSLGIASHPLGPYTTRQSGVLTIGGAGVGEVDSITGASLFFHPTQPRVYMFYSAVAAGGFPWMTSLAIATY